MRFYVISDNVDTQVGMRLAGIEGVVVHEEDEVRKALSDAMEQEDIAVVLMTEHLVRLCPEPVPSPDCGDPRPARQRPGQGFHHPLCPGRHRCPAVGPPTQSGGRPCNPCERQVADYGEQRRESQ